MGINDQNVLKQQFTMDAPVVLDKDLATKQYVDGVKPWAAVRAASFSQMDLVTAGTLMIDDVTIVAGDRVLLYGQTNPAENGIYDVAEDSGDLILTRAADATLPRQFIPGRQVFVMGGTRFGKTQFTLENEVPEVGSYVPVFTPAIMPLAEGGNVKFEWKDGQLEISASCADPFPEHLYRLPDVEYSLHSEVLPIPTDIEPEAPGQPFRWALFSDLREDLVIGHLPDVKSMFSREELPGATKPSDADGGIRWAMFTDDRYTPDVELDDVRYHFDPGNLHGLGGPSDEDCGVRWNLRSTLRDITTTDLDDVVYSADGGVLSGGGLPSDKDNGLRFKLFSADRAVFDTFGMRDFNYLLDPGLAGQTKVYPSDADTGFRFNLLSGVRDGIRVTDNVDILGNHSDHTNLPGSTKPSDADSGIRLELYATSRDNAELSPLEDLRYHFEPGVLGGAAKESDDNSGIAMRLFSGVRVFVGTYDLVDIIISDETWYLSGNTLPSDLNSGARFNLSSGDRAEVATELDDVLYSSDVSVFPAYYGPSRADSGLRFAIPAATARASEAVGVLEDIAYSQ